MQKLLKFIAYLFITLALLLVIGIFFLVTFVKPEKFKPQIEQYVQQTTNRQFTINGDMRWTFFPMLGIKADDITFANPNNFPVDNFISVKEVEMSVAALPLWRGDIRIGTLKLDGAIIHFIKNAQGQTNWQDLLQKKSQQTALNNDPPTPSQNRLSSYFKFSGATISTIKIASSKIIYDDNMAAQHFVLDNINMESKDIALNQAFPFSLEFLAQLNPKAKSIQNKISADITFSPLSQTVELDNLKASINQFNLAGKLSINHLVNSPTITGNITIPSFNANQWLASIGKSVNNAALQKVNAVFNLQADSNTIQIQNLKAQIDDSTFTGNISANGKSHKLINFELTIDQLNLNKFLQAKNTTVAFNQLSPINTANASENAANLLPVAALQQLNAQGHVSIGKVILPQFTAQQVSATLLAKQGMIQISPLLAQIYSGQLQSNINIDARGNNPLWKINSNFTHINIAALLDNLQKTKRFQISGTGNVAANISTAGNTTDVLKQNTNGNVKFDLTNGILHGIDIPYYSDLADALINKTQPTKSNTKQTPFGTMTGTLQIANGIINNNDLLIQAPQMTVTGKGAANLISEQLNYEMLLQRLTSGSVGKPRGPAIPILISGPFANPQIRPDWRALVVSQAKAQLQNQLQQRQQDINDKIKNAVGNEQVANQISQGLQSLLGN